MSYRTSPAPHPPSSSLTLSPPHSIAAEQSVLGALLMINGLFYEQCDGLDSGDFFVRSHQAIFDCIKGLIEDKEPADAVTVAEALKDSDVELVYIASLAKDVVSVANAGGYARLVKEHSQRRKLIRFASEICSIAWDLDNKTTSQAFEEIESELLKASIRTEDKKNTVIHGSKVYRETTKAMERLAKLEDGELLGCTTGLKLLDAKTCGLQRNDLVIVAGRPSMGKTALCGCLERACADGGGAVLTFNLEMPADHLMRRHISAWGGVNMEKMRNGRFEEEDWSKTLAAGKRVKGLQLYFDNDRSLTMQKICSRARRKHRELLKSGHGLRMVTIDYLQLIQSEGKKNNRVEEISEITRRAKLLAIELDCTVVLLSQLNRNLESRPNKRPVMSDLRDSGSIEQDADLILFIYRDEVYDPKSPEQGVAEIDVAKQRNGTTGRVSVASQLQFARFMDLAIGRNLIE